MKILGCIALALAIIVLIPFAISTICLMIEYVEDKKYWDKIEKHEKENVDD